MRHDDVGRPGDVGSVGEIRGNALWGGRRTLPAMLAALLVLALSFAG
jgi:hypothetical protein